jgi:hypothetical protein
MALNVSVSDSDMRSCFEFCLGQDSSIPLPPAEKPGSFLPHPGTETVLRLILRALDKKGFHISEPSHGKMGEAGAYVSFPDYTVDVVLCAICSENATRFSLLTWKRSSSSGPNTLSAPLDQWRKLCEAMDQILAENLKADSLQWLTRNEAEALWRKYEQASLGKP